MSLPTFLALAENRLKYAGKRDRTINIKLAVGTARMMIEAERTMLRLTRDDLEILVACLDTAEHQARTMLRSPEEATAFRGDAKRARQALRRVQAVLGLADAQRAPTPAPVPANPYLVDPPVWPEREDSYVDLYLAGIMNRK